MANKYQKPLTFLGVPNQTNVGGRVHAYLPFHFGGFKFEREGHFMSDFWDYRGWQRREENANWVDIQGENLEYRADGLMNLAINNGLDENSLDKTITYLGAAVEINRDIERMPELLQCLLMLGDCYLKQGKPEEVNAVAIEAQQIALSIFDDHGRAYAIHMQGFNSFECKKYNEAAEHAFNAGEIYAESGHFDDAAEVFLSAGRLFRWQGERAKSIEAFEKALSAARAEENLENIVTAKLWIAFMKARVERIDRQEAISEALAQANAQMKMAKSSSSMTRRFELAWAWNNVDQNPYEAIKHFDNWLNQARENKVLNDSVEAMLGRAYCLRFLGQEEEFVSSMLSILATLEDIESTVSVLEAVQPLSDYYFDREQFAEAELIWVRGKAIAQNKSATTEELNTFDQMVALCIAEYAEPGRAITALENALPKTSAKPLKFEFEFALAKSYAKDNRSTESLLVIERALENLGDSSNGELMYAELHELKCELFAGQGNMAAAKLEAKISFDAYLDLELMEKALRLKQQYLQTRPGDPHPETGAITLGSWQ